MLETLAEMARKCKKLKIGFDEDFGDFGMILNRLACLSDADCLIDRLFG